MSGGIAACAFSFFLGPWGEMMSEPFGAETLVLVNVPSIRQ